MAMNTGGGGSELSEINVTPLVDVMLVLLVIFMVTAPMIEQEEKDKRKVDLDLPVTRDNPNRINPEDTDKLILEVDRDLKVRIGEELLVDCGDKKEGSDPQRFEACFTTVEKKLVNNQKLKEQGELYLLADTEIPYGFVVGTMARIKQAGINKLGMVTNPEYLQQEAAEEADK
ncbi:protein TolR [Persicimonas caeni]|uniref:Protein TolR n=1 Tax=Persicimonas caeni TaxID=2292766 RepID=A0A4Y6Q181_PERCE|nr:biopolymer transporter ExbD [Persicimonas caeni]QDG54303.1 protein TolR [Persicimonas caeni]QED35524.1 protein TolR [Persicimonas caeni]